MATDRTKPKARRRRHGGSKKGRRWKTTAAKLSEVKRMKRAGTSTSEIARVTGLSRPTIYRLFGS